MYDRFLTEEGDISAKTVGSRNKPMDGTEQAIWTFGETLTDIMYQFSCVRFTVFKLLLQTLHLLSAVSQPLLQFWDLTEHIHIIQINQPRSCDVWVNWRITVLSPVRLSSLCKPWTNRLCAWPESADLWCWLSVERSGNKWETGILSLIAVWNNTVWQH